MDLSLDCWNYNLSIVKFSTENALLKFVSDCQPLMDQVVKDNDHDRFTYFIDFYREFKAQSAPLVEFFARYNPKDYPTENRPDCIGRALKLKSILANAYSELEDKLYVASNTFDYLNQNRKLTKELEDNYHYYVSFNEHCVLTLKFEVDGRAGFVLYEMSFLNDKPIIVMVDNQKPSYGTVSLPKGKRATFVCKGEKYVEVSCAPEEGAEGSVTGIDVYTLVLFVGGSFQRPDLSAIFCLIPNIQYTYSIRGGNLVSNFSHYGDDQFYHLQRWDQRVNDLVKFKIPLGYFSRGERNEQYEHEIEELAKLLPYEHYFLRESLVTISGIQSDKEFLKQLFDLPLTMISTRKMYIKSKMNNTESP